MPCVNRHEETTRARIHYINTAVEEWREQQSLEKFKQNQQVNKTKFFIKQMNLQLLTCFLFVMGIGVTNLILKAKNTNDRNGLLKKNRNGFGISTSDDTS